MTTRNFGKKIAFGFAVASFIGMAISLVFFLYLLFTSGISDVITASMMATTLFLLSCGVVLYLMSKPPKHKLEPWDSVEKAE
jgi:predicted membrane channel-forming protein YqfA (hemolysin III family)